jgi:Tol biopolymer transport system component
VPIVLALLVGCLILAGCGSAKEEPAAAPESDDPGMIVFTGAELSEGGWIRAIRPDGTGMQPFELRDSCEEPIDFSADGRTVACEPPTGSYAIYVMRRDGSDWHRVPLPPGYSHSPSLSPDGEQFAFLHSREYGETYELWKAGIGGDHAELLVAGDLRAPPPAIFGPAWSPDGERIAFIRVSDSVGCGWSMTGDVAVADPKGGEERVVVGEAEAPEWAPDGKRLAFLRKESAPRRSSREGADSDYVGSSCTIWTVPIDGGQATPLARDVYTPEIAWSPDGRQIAFLRAVTCPLACRVRVFVVPATGGKAQPIGPDLAETADVFWLPSSAVSTASSSAATQ